MAKNRTPFKDWLADRQYGDPRQEQIRHWLAMHTYPWMIATTGIDKNRLPGCLKNEQDLEYLRKITEDAMDKTRQWPSDFQDHEIDDQVENGKRNHRMRSWPF